MKIDVRDIKTIYINMNSEPKKKEATEKILKRLKFKDWDRFPGVVDKRFQRAIKSHYKLLSDPNLKAPFTVLEDDIIYKESDKMIYNVPDNADALYLGTTTLGYILDYTGRFVVYKPVPKNKDIVRVYNMLIAHAIIYLSDDYKNMVKRCCEYHLEENPNKAFDLSVAEIMKYYKVYALDKPMFSQVGQNRGITNVILTQTGITGRKANEVYGRLQKCRISANENNLSARFPRFAPFRYNGMKIIDGNHAQTKNT